MKKTYISFWRKYSFLAKTKYKIDEKTYLKDKEFIEFASKYRNTMFHSNGIFNQKEYSFSFMGYTFIFKPQEQIDIAGDEVVLEDALFHISMELRKIFYRLTST